MTVSIDGDGSRTVAVDHVLMMSQRRRGVGCFRSLGFSGRFRTSRSLLAGKIVLGEALLPGLALPVIIPHSSSVVNDPAAKLTKHGFCRDDGNLTGSVGVRENILPNEFLLFRLRCDDLE